MTLLHSDPTAPSAWYGNLPVTSRYTYGIAGEKFFRTLKDEGELLGSVCHTCEHTYVPATMFCERCLGEITEFVKVGIQGEVQTFTFLFENPDGSPRETPEIIAFIKIGDGGLIHRLGDVEIDDIFIGMQVEAVLKPKEKREGSILDIEYFKPVKLT